MIDFNSGEKSPDMIELSRTKRCVIYARCSTSYQEESIESQISFNEAFAKRNGLKIVGVFKDDGKSGRNADREGLQALMSELSNPEREWDLVLVYRLDRFFRNARLFMEYQYTMKDYDTNLLTAQESMLNNVFPMTETFRFFVAQQAELESHRIGENIARGKLTGAQKGRWQGGTAPLGYQVIDGILTIDPKKKLIVEKIFNQRAQGVSMQKIADILNEQGYTSKLNRQFKVSGIREIITNPCYKGELQYNRSSARGTNGFNRHLYKDEKLIVKYSCTPIVSPELWDKAQPEASKKKRSSKSTRYLLSGKVFCKNCGDQVMHANRRNNHDKLYISFYCPNSKAHRECDVKEVDMFKLEDFVLNCLCQKLLSKEFLQTFSENFSNLSKKNKAKLSELKTQHSRLKKRCDNLISQLEECSEETSEQITERLDILAKEKAELSIAITELTRSLSYVPSEDDIIRARSIFISYCKQETNRYFVESLIRTYVERVDIDNEGATVSLLAC